MQSDIPRPVFPSYKSLETATSGPLAPSVSFCNIGVESNAVPMNNIAIRAATIDDFETIYSFVCSLMEITFDKRMLRQCYQICLACPNNYYLVALNDDKAIGYLSCHGQVLLHHGGMVYEIQELYVLPEYRSEGVGKLLLHSIERHLVGDKYKLLEVASNMRRVDAHRFYETNGFDKNTFKFVKYPSVKS